MKIKQITNQDEYNIYSNFIVENLPKVTSELLIMGLKFKTLLDTDLDTAKMAFWKMVEQENLKLYISEKDNNIVAFSVMESTPFLRYLFVDELKRKQSIGTEIINYFKKNNVKYSVKIDQKKYKAGLGDFYEKNGFKFKKKHTSQITYYEYSL